MAKAKQAGPELFEETAAPQGENNQTIKGETKPAKPQKKAGAVIVHKPASPGEHPLDAERRDGGALALLQTVERLSTNKDTNPAIVEMLLKEMRELRAEQAKARFDAALAEVQGELPIIDRRGKIEVRAKDAKGERTGNVTQSTPYALYEDIIEKVLPILSAKGFSVSNIIDSTEKVQVETILSGYGHERRSKLTLMHDSTGSKNSVQAVVSSVSYAKRINLCALLSIATRGEDDDGASTGGPAVLGEPLSSEQTEQLFDLCKAVRVKRDALLDLMNSRRPKGHPEAKEIGQLPASRFEEAVAELRAVEAHDREQKAAAQGAKA